ncbi:MAG: hypothetical protein AB1529_06200 [Candidatus Micrarchaeota archaeon]
MKGQASAEYLLLALVALSLLALSLSSLSAIKGYAERGIAAYSFRASAMSLAGAIDEVCALGAGNMRRLELPSELSLEPVESDDGWLVRLSGANASIVRAVPCEADASGGLSGTVYVENKDGKARIRAR